jgi:hypothetical protein
MKYIIITLVLALLQGCSDQASISTLAPSEDADVKTPDTVTPTPKITIKAQGIDVLVSAEPKIAGTVAPQTLASRSFSPSEVTEHQLSWWIKNDELFLSTNISRGLLMHIPENFVPQEEMLNDRKYRLGTFTKNGVAMFLVLEIRNQK